MAVTESMLTLLNDSMPPQKTFVQKVAEAREKIEVLDAVLARIAKSGDSASDADVKKARELGEEVGFLTKTLSIR